MKTFEVGQKVRIVSYADDDQHEYAGRVGVVTRLSKHQDYPFRVEFDVNGQVKDEVFASFELEAIDDDDDT